MIEIKKLKEPKEIRCLICWGIKLCEYEQVLILKKEGSIITERDEVCRGCVENILAPHLKKEITLEERINLQVKQMQISCNQVRKQLNN